MQILQLGDNSGLSSRPTPSLVALSANFSVVSAGSVSRVLRLQRWQLRLRLKHSVGL